MLSRPRSPRPSRRPSPPTILLSSPPGMGAAAAEGMSGPRPRGDWGLTWAYAQALNAGREPLMQQSGATVAAVDGSNSWWLNTFRSQEMTNSSPCPSPPRSAGYEGALTVLRGDEPERIGRTSRAYFSRRRRSRQPAALVALNRSARPNQDRRATHPQDDRGAAKRIPPGPGRGVGDLHEMIHGIVPPGRTRGARPDESAGGGE